MCIPFNVPGHNEGRAIHYIGNLQQHPLSLLPVSGASLCIDELNLYHIAGGIVQSLTW